MALLQLPPELLLHIIGYLGTDFFAQDIRRLAVSRKWYELAWTVLARNLRFSPRSLMRFTENEAAMARSQPYVATVELRFEGHVVPDRGQLQENGGPVAVSDDDEWATHLNSSLTKLAATLRQSPGLRSLELKARILGPHYRRYLMAKPLADLISLRQLTSLQLDTATCQLNQPQSGPVHLCRSINALLPSLRRLHCRMERLCETLLEPPPGDTPLALEEVVVNLSISQLSDTYYAYRHAKACHSPTASILQLKEVMQKQATALAARLQNPRMVRVITHSLPSFDIYAFDAVKRREVRLENNVNWNAKGVVVHEEQPDGSDHDDRDLFDDDELPTPLIVF